ncbi:MAG: hypothetical protein ACXABO_05600 [Promethearchaeota archaeon]|jgi:predicted Zn-dependent protease
MPKFQKYEQKIRKYKDKLKKFVIRIGIYSNEEFELLDENPRKLVLPCHLGILLCGDFDDLLIKQIQSRLDQVYDSFFFEVRNLGYYNFSKELFSKGIKREYKEMRKTNDKLKIHPTNKFYQILLNKKQEENLGMIIGLTDLPLYSSSDDNIFFLFGEAHLKLRCCVVSSLKLKEKFYNRQNNQNLLRRRIVKEIIHEIGHLILGPEHCQKSFCAMKSSDVIEEIDTKSYDLCESCKTKLATIRVKSNF